MGEFTVPSGFMMKQEYKTSPKKAPRKKKSLGSEDGATPSVFEGLGPEVVLCTATRGCRDTRASSCAAPLRQLRIFGFLCDAWSRSFWFPYRKKIGYPDSNFSTGGPSGAVNESKTMEGERVLWP